MIIPYKEIHVPLQSVSVFEIETTNIHVLEYVCKHQLHIALQVHLTINLVYPHLCNYYNDSMQAMKLMLSMV